ncbi:MAG TPA: ABC transporter ATP-binding protein [Mobilitalea sp.]|nr:ABC transporter ATP-binding protein [Mobilitalea sp.]
MLEVLKDSLRYFKKYIPVFFLCVFLGLGMTITMILEPQVITLIVDRVITPALGGESTSDSSVFLFLVKNIPADHYWQTLGVLIMVFVVLILIYFVTFYIRWNTSHYFGVKCENAMRRDAVNKINSASSTIINQYTSGELLTISNSDPQQVKDIYMMYLPFSIEPIIYISLAVYTVSRMNLTLAVFPIVTGVFYLLVTRRYIRETRHMYNDIRNTNVDLNTETQESIYGIRTIKAYAKEEFQAEKFNLRSEEVRKALFRFGDFRAWYNLIYGGIQNVLYIISIILGITLAVHFKMTNGEFTSFLAYMMSISGYFIGFTYQLGALQSGVISGKRLFDFLNMPDPVAESYGAGTVSKKPAIELQGVGVTVDGHQLLKDVNLTIPYGAKIGIMGSTGSGKSVLLKALQTLVEVTEGEITIDGRQFKEYSRSEIIRSYSYAMQDVFLFSNSIEANIALYNPDVPSEEVVKYASIAEVNEFASSFPEGYQSLIGEKGFGLSGGQKQRVAIARALLKDAPVIVLDDCTSALDMETESKIFKNMKKHCKEKTLLVATHRASAIKDADEILLFENGSIVERGTHEELMKINGRYADIYNLQTGEEVFVNE